MVGRQVPLRVLLTCLVISTISGCVNLDKKQPSNVPYPKQSLNSKTPAAIAVAAQQAAAGPMKFAEKLKQAVRPKSQNSYESRRVAKDDPTSLQHDPGPLGPDLYIASARLAERSGALDKAMEQYRRALQRDARNRNAMIGLARLQHRTGDMRGAISVYQKALEVYRNDPVILNDLGLCYARNGQVDQAISVLRGATQAAPEREMYRNNLAAALVEANRADEAVAHLSQTYGAAVANYNVGYLLNRGGQQMEANLYLEKALEIDPSMDQARQLLRQNITNVSSRPQYADRRATGYQPPVTSRPGNSLTPPRHTPRPPGENEPRVPETPPSHLRQKPQRFGPFGFVPAPPGKQPETMLVSHSEPIEAPLPKLKPATPTLQPVYAVSVPLRMPAEAYRSGRGDNDPPSP